MIKNPKLAYGVNQNNFVLLVKGDSVKEQFISLIGYSNSDELGAIMIPENTRVEIPGIGVNRIYHAYKYGKSKKLLETVENLTNIKNLGYLEISEKQLVSLIDWSNGLEVNSKAMQLGQRLSGQDAVELLKDSDKNKVELKKAMLRSFIVKLAKKAETNAPNWIVWRNRIETNLKVSYLKNLFDRLVDLREDDISIINLPGREERINGIKYWLPSVHRFKYLMFDFKENFSLVDWESIYGNEHLKRRAKIVKREFVSQAISTSAISSSAINSSAINSSALSSSSQVKPLATTTSSRSTATVSKSTSSTTSYSNTLTFDIALLDGGASTQEIVNVGNKLKDFGLKLTTTNKLKRKYKSSYIIYRSGHESEAKLVAGILNIKKIMVRTNSFDDLGSVMILLCADYKSK